MLGRLAQLDTLEPLDDDEAGLVVDPVLPPHEIADQVLSRLGLG